MSILERTKNAWNAFRYKETKQYADMDVGQAYGSYQPFYRAYKFSKGSIIDTIITRIAIDVSMIGFKHVKKDSDPKTQETVNDGLNRCLTLEANIDQSYVDFLQDIVFSMFDEGVVAVVPVDTKYNPNDTSSYDILSMRTGKITQWFPQGVMVRLYNEETGKAEEILCSKRNIAIIENPLYAVVNAENSTLKRLIRKLQLMDTVDEKNSSNKLDIILQMPYAIKNSLKEEQANKRVSNIEEQLANSKYGIAYIDQTERITQLNRSLDNHLLDEIKNLKQELFNQLGLTENIFNGTASEQELRSYYNRTINPIAKRIATEYKRKFLTDTARTQGHDIVYYSSPFELVPISTIASSAESLRRNAIITSNEIREGIGLPPSDDPQADMLFNPNMPMDKQMSPGGQNGMGDQQAQQIFDQLDDDQFNELVEYIRSIVDPSIPDDQMFDNLSEEQMQMAVQKAQELLNGGSNEEEEPIEE